MTQIHPTALIGKNVLIAPTASIGAYAIIEDNVKIEDGVIVEPHARLCSGTILKKDCKICSFCTIAGLPQDLHFDQSTISFAEIGERTVVREGTTIHRATSEGGVTKIGADCLLMANSHVGHDCILEDRVIEASFAAIAGHTVIGCDAFVSGGVMVHQKMRIGCGVMLSGNSAFSKDVPPYVNGYLRNTVGGLNLIGLLRRRVSRAAIANIKELYAHVYAGGNPRKNAQDALDSGLVTSKEGEIFIRFFTDAPEGRHFVTPAKGEEL